MKVNATQVSYFILGAYFDTGLLKYVFFIIILLLYILIIVTNLFLIVIICMNRSLHEPMYLFLVSLFANELFGSSGLFPFLMVQILSDIHTVSASLCFLQVFCVYSYACVEFFTLAVMSYDRYLAICCPLQYNTCMTYNRVAVLVTLTWVLPFLEVVIATVLSSSLQLCGNIIDKVICGNYSIIQLACTGTSVNNIYGLTLWFVTVFAPLALILYTYMKILKVCFSGSKQTKQKAVSTCTPHLASLLNFSFGVCFQILQSRFSVDSAPDVFNIFLSVYFLSCQPLFSPLMYGLRMSKINLLCKSLFCRK